MAKLYIKNTDGTFTPYSPIAVTNLDIVQGKGNSLTSAMSQKAVTDEFGTIQDAIASIVNAGYVFAGVATPSTDPSTPNAKVFYIANGKGTYTNFGGLKVTEDEVVVLKYDTAWHKVATGITAKYVTDELVLQMEGIYGTKKSQSITATTGEILAKNKFLPIRVFKGEKFKVKFDVSGAWTRFILIYNDKNEKRLIDTTDQSKVGTWFEFFAPEDITSLGIYVTSSESFGTVTISIDYDGIDLSINRQQTNGAEARTGFSFMNAIRGEYYLISNGAVSLSSSYARLPIIKILGADSFSFRGVPLFGSIVYFSATGDFMSATSVSGVRTVSIPSGAAYIGINIYLSKYPNGYDDGYVIVNSPLNQDIAELENGVSILKTKTSPLSYRLTANIFNPKTVIVGVLEGKGNVETTGSVAESYYTSDFIPVEPSTAYVILGKNEITNIRLYELYDAKKNPIYFHQSSTNAFTTDADTYFIRFSISKSYLVNETALSKADVTSFEEYAEIISYDDGLLLSENEENDLMNKKKVQEAVQVGIDGISSARALTATFENSKNLLDSSEIVVGKFLEHNNSLVDLASYNTTGYIPVQPNTTYLFRKRNWAVYGTRSWAEYGDNKTKIQYYNTPDSPSSITTGVNTYFIRFSYLSSAGTSDVVVFASSESEWSDYGEIVDIEVNGKPRKYKEKSAISLVTKEDLMTAINGADDKSGLVSFEKIGKDLKVTSGDFTINASLDLKPLDLYTYNHEFNFESVVHNPSQTTIKVTDDVAPAHIINTTIGANHGQPCGIATIQGHGLTNTAIGTAWNHSNGKVYYITRIVNENQIQFLSANQGTSVSPSFVALEIGTITNSSTTLTISEVSSSQLYPSSLNVQHHIMLNGEKEIIDDGTYNCRFFDVVETYDVGDPVSVLENLIARVGSSDAPTMEGDSLIKFKNIYRFLPGNNVVIFCTYVPQKEMAFSNFMFCQSELPAKGKFSYYLPNSNPINGYDFRTPLKVTWSSSIPSLNVTTANMADPNNPVNRVVTYGDQYGFALGFCKTAGVGKNLNDYTANTFELRNNSGKIYPHGVDSYKVGNTIQAGQVFSAVMYRAFINNATAIGNRMSMYHVNVNGEELVFLDYKGSMTDYVQVNKALDGKTIEVVESVNTTLLSDIYNDGFYVKADYVSEETCFMVVKIKR